MNISSLAFIIFAKVLEIVNFLFHFAVEFPSVKGLVVSQNTLCSGTSIFHEAWEIL